MPRTKTIGWEQRVSVFLAYRRNGGKVNPVAKRYGIARSTVGVIIKEFKDMGFAEQPRVNLSPEFLTEMQEQHFQEVLGQSGGPSKPEHPQITELTSFLGWKLATDERDAKSLANAESPPIPEDLQWHLKGTTAERIIQEALRAAHDFHQRDYAVWRDLRLALEKACQLEERDTATNVDREPRLLPALKKLFHSTFFDWNFRSQAPTPDWLEWNVDSDDPPVLRLKVPRVAVGSPEDHERVMGGVAGFLANSFREFQRRFLEVARLHRDLGLFQGVVEKSLGEVREEEVRLRICPACPYPEARQEPESNTSMNKRPAREE